MELEERNLFEILNTVSGVGPRVAIAILSIFNPSSLVRLVQENSISSLVSVPGIGRRTAEKILVELRAAEFEAERPTFVLKQFPQFGTLLLIAL